MSDSKTAEKDPETPETPEVETPKTEPAVAPEPPKAPPAEAAVPPNEAYIDNNVMTIKLYLWGDAAYAKTIGSLELAKEIAKTHFGMVQARAAMSRPRIIKPGSIN